VRGLGFRLGCCLPAENDLKMDSVQVLQLKMARDMITFVEMTVLVFWSFIGSEVMEWRLIGGSRL
jgi:hypothetical protein